MPYDEYDPEEPECMSFPKLMLLRKKASMSKTYTFDWKKMNQEEREIYIKHYGEPSDERKKDGPSIMIF